MKRTPLLVLASTVCVSLPGEASTVSVLDPGILVLSPAIAVGTDGLALIAYVGNNSLKVAHCSNSACTTATISTLGPVGEGGGQVSLAIGTDGRGIIAYYVTTAPEGLRVAHCSDQACTGAAVATIDSGWVAGRTSIAIGASGRPLVVYPLIDGQSGRVAAAYCADTACSSAASTSVAPLALSTGWHDTSVAIGTDGLPLVAYVPVGAAFGPPTPPIVIRCADAACTTPIARTPTPPVVRAAETQVLFSSTVSQPSLFVGADGRGLLSYYSRSLTLPPLPSGAEVHLRHCADAACSSFESDVVLPDASLEVVNAPFTAGPGGMPWFARPRHGQIRLAQCEDAACTTRNETCATALADQLALARGADGVALVAFSSTGSTQTHLGVAHGFDPCLPAAASAADASTMETNFPFSLVDVTVTLDHAPDAEGTIDYATADGTALAGVDYATTSGTLTFSAGGGVSRTVSVGIVGDALDEPVEHFSIVLSNAQGGVTVADGRADVAIQDNDIEPMLMADNCSVLEGNATGGTCEVPLRLASASGWTVTVGYATADGTATAGTDYTAALGTATFAPGETQKTVAIAVTGDSAVEPDESFHFVMEEPVNARLFFPTAEGTIVDDDFSSLSSLELTHGTRLVADLSAASGPAAGVDLYRLAQAPMTSWEVVVDGATGDGATGIVLERLGTDGTTVLQTAQAPGTGGALSMRFQNRLPSPVLSQHIRVRSVSCGSACDAGDTYRLRVYETTARLSRFNNDGAQGTVLILQNATDASTTGWIDLWSENGVRIGWSGVNLAPRAVEVLDLATIVPDTSGSITITSDAPYGGLSGKAVAIDPQTALAFDTPLEYRPR